MSKTVETTFLPRINAPAKINLSLTVEGKRADGYHQIHGLVAFAAIGDALSFMQGRSGKTEQWSLQLEGPFATQLAKENPRDNLVLKAAEWYGQQVGDMPCGRFILQKNLPVASGMGGGSADAAAALKLLQGPGRSGPDDQALHEVALQLGADVPMCLSSVAGMIGGIGEIFEPVAGFPTLPCVLVNPGVGVATADVFGALNASPLQPGDCKVNLQPPPPPPNTFSGLIDWLQKRPNDLQPVAVEIAPVITCVLEELQNNPHCRLARMSGSGATCFGLFEHEKQARAAANRIAIDHPRWWAVATLLH